MRAKSLSIGTLFLTLSLVLAFSGVVTQAAPKPTLANKSWQFKFKFEAPRPIAVKNLRGQVEWFWYMSYEVINNTGKERLFIPEFIVASDKGDRITAGLGVRTSVFTAIKKRVNNRLLESPTDVVGRLLQGDDNGKESVIVWRATKHDVDRVSVFIGGLSGETAVIKVPNAKDPSKPTEAILSKTLQVDYFFPGAPAKPDAQEVVAKGQRWIMR